MDKFEVDGIEYHPPLPAPSWIYAVTCNGKDGEEHNDSHMQHHAAYHVCVFTDSRPMERYL